MGKLCSKFCLACRGHGSPIHSPDDKNISILPAHSIFCCPSYQTRGPEVGMGGSQSQCGATDRSKLQSLVRFATVASLMGEWESHRTPRWILPDVGSWSWDIISGHTGHALADSQIPTCKHSQLFSTEKNKFIYKGLKEKTKALLAIAKTHPIPALPRSESH